MKPEHRSALLALAARRGQKGFSEALAEVIEDYLQGDRERKRRREALRRLAGCLRAKEAEDLRQVTKALRDNWR